MEVRSGEIGTVDEITREVTNDLVDECVSNVFNLLTTVWSSTNTPSNYIDASSTGLTNTVLQTGIENTIDKIGNVRAIVGTRRALLPLYSLAGYVDVLLADGTTRQALPLDEILMERYNTNTVSRYLGIPVVTIPQILGNTLPTINRKLVRDDVVLIVGDNAGEIVLYGAPEDQEFIDGSKQPAEWQYHTWQSFGILLDRPEAITVVKVA
jgi:hypothetical protein